MTRFLGLVCLFWSCILSVFGSSEATAQGLKQAEYKQWFQAKLNVLPTKRLSIAAVYTLRTGGLLDRFDGSYYGVRMRYKLTTRLFTDVQFRIRDNFSGTRFRSQLGMSYRIKSIENVYTFNAAYFNQRNHLQFESMDGLNVGHFLRGGVTYKRRISKVLDAFGGVEPVVQLVNGGIVTRRVNLEAGFDYLLAKNHILSVEYAYRMNRPGQNAANWHIMTVGYERLLALYSTKKGEKYKDLRNSIKDFRRR